MIGKILGGRYEIIRQLGRGAFGTTFLAVDRQLPDHDQCVVKQLKPLATDPLTLQVARPLFDNEARVLNRLGTHDQIPRLLAHFEEEQEFYLVQEFVEGHDLTHEITPGKQSREDEVIALLQGTLEVLAFVHQHNVIHRDIKPSNLIRRRQDGKIVLIDFGAVKQIGSQVVNAQGQTILSVAVGTPGYMPSEQTHGDPRLCSDIYAVGMVGIQALTGLPPNQLPKDHDTGEIIWRNRAQVSPKLAKVLEKMVRYHFSQRYQSASEVLQALQGLTTPEPPTVRLPPDPEPTPIPPPKPRPILWKALIGLGITAVATVIVLLLRLTSNSLLTYDNPTYGISIKYPQIWTTKNTPNPITRSLATVTFVSPQESVSDVFQENLSLIVEDLSGKNVMLGEYTRTFINEIKQFSPDAEIVEEGNTQLANRPAHQVVYTVKDGGDSLKRLQVWTVKDNKAYIITYTAESAKYSEVLKTAQEMINSFEIK